MHGLCHFFKLTHLNSGTMYVFNKSALTWSRMLNISDNINTSICKVGAYKSSPALQWLHSDYSNLVLSELSCLVKQPFIISGSHYLTMQMCFNFSHTSCAIKKSFYCWNKNTPTVCRQTAWRKLSSPLLLKKIFSKQDPLSTLKRDPLSNAKWLSWPALMVGHSLHKGGWSVK